jgi:hypothetical protein
MRFVAFGALSRQPGRHGRAAAEDAAAGARDLSVRDETGDHVVHQQIFSTVQFGHKPFSPMNQYWTEL